MCSGEAGLVVMTKQRPVSILTQDKSHWPITADLRLMLLGNKLSYLQNAVLHITFSKMRVISNLSNLTALFYMAVEKQISKQTNKKQVTNLFSIEEYSFGHNEPTPKEFIIRRPCYKKTHIDALAGVTKWLDHQPGH